MIRAESRNSVAGQHAPLEDCWSTAKEIINAVAKSIFGKFLYCFQEGREKYGSLLTEQCEANERRKHHFDEHLNGVQNAGTEVR